MYEKYFEMKQTPFARDISPKAMYESSNMREVLARLGYAADRQLFAVVEYSGRF